MQVLEKDISIQFPHLVVLKASAGAGKTHALSKRFVQFILSDKVPDNALRNILAITFSNNAAKEMKERILKWLKLVCLGFKEAEEIREIVLLDKDELMDRAGRMIDKILNNYSDFQVRTIDSFMAAIFKSSAIDFGYNPEFEILLNNNALMEYSFDLFLRNVKEGTEEQGLFKEIIAKIHGQKKGEASYLWNPADDILDEMKNMRGKLVSLWKEPKGKDFKKEMSAVEDKLMAVVEQIENVIEKYGLTRRKNSKYDTIRNSVMEGRFADIVGETGKNCPVTKPDKKQTDLQVYFNNVVDLWEELCTLIKQYTSIYARGYYEPYLKVYNKFIDTVEKVKREQEKIFIGDINKDLAGYLNKEIVPDIYFQIGDKISHFLIDEFQDTSPIQWKILFPLLENSLSQNGSLFVVGDTKQAIYGFRNADYAIMRDLETRNPFPSARHIVAELNINYRSKERVLDFSKKVFKEIAAGSDKYSEAGKRSGLADYLQDAEDKNKNKGYAEAVILNGDKENPPEKQRIKELIKELLKRGCQYKDIAVLARKNTDVVKITSWLNEDDGIPFISHSSLDIRQRKVTLEIVSLLNFLDSPMDDLSFASFIMGDIFEKMLMTHYQDINRKKLQEFFFVHRNNSPLYKSFQAEFENIWETHFAGLFKASGYLPLYDLVTEIFSTFKIFEICKDEEASLVKILEVIKEFEGAGFNTLKDFLEFAGESDGNESAWEINISKEADAVNVMTFHKAKGLEFPVVIALVYPEQHTGFDYIVNEDEKSVYLLKVTKSIAEADAQLEECYNEERIKDMVNSLNTAYVGFTRAEEELYVIGVQEGRSGFPIDILPANDFPPSDKPEKCASPAQKTHSTQIEISHSSKNIEWRTDIVKTLNIEERQRGEFIHRVLYFIEYINDRFEDEICEIIRMVKDEMDIDYPENQIKDALVNIINSRISEYFMPRPDRIIKMEQEFSDRQGNLFRMDRVVIDNVRVTVIDYKTGMDKDAEDKYVSQIRNYINILKEIYPDKTASGVIAYIDLKEIRRII